MITYEQFSNFSAIDKSNYLRENFPASRKSISFRRPSYGFGINDSDYISQPKIDGKLARCPAYTSWTGIMCRSYCKLFKSKQPTYSDVVVCKDWLSFMNFRSWWIENCVDGYEIDKDIIGSGNIYSPSDCIFVPKWLNDFTNDHMAKRGDFPIGVHLNSENGKYVAQCGHPMKKREFLGYFKNPTEAHDEWKKRKLQIAHDLKYEMDVVDARIYERIISRISSLV